MKLIILFFKRTLLVAVAVGLVIFTACHKKTERPAVSVTDFAPAQGPVGTVVTINGNNFSTTAASNAVSFNGTVAMVTSATATSLVATVPPGAASGKISVTVGDNTGVSGSDFAVLVAPTVSSFSPASGVAGTTVTITGTNFDAIAANNTVKFSGTVASITQASPTSLTVTVPAGAATGKITVTVNGLTATSANDFTVPLSPAITSFAPTNGPVGTTVTITGTNFDATAANNSVKFNGTATPVAAATATTLKVTVPAGATTGKITVTTNTLTATSTADFLVPAIIASFSPSGDIIGATITITGTNFDATAANNTVKFNGTNTVVSAASATSLTCTVPPAATSGKITVTVGGVTATSTNDFTVYQAPTISGFSPLSATIGTDIVINGSNFDITAANNMVKFYSAATNSVSVTATVKSVNNAGTALTVTVPSGASTGKVSVTTHTLSVTSASDFTVMQTPTISGFNPASAAVGTDVTINGSNFDPVAANNIVKFYSSITQQISVAAPVKGVDQNGNLIVAVPQGATTGKVSVTVNGLTASSVGDFTVTQSAIRWRVKERWENGLKVKAYIYNNANQLTQVNGYATDLQTNTTSQYDQTSYQYDNQGRWIHSETFQVSTPSFRTAIFDITYNNTTISTTFSKDLLNAQNMPVETLQQTSVSSLSNSQITKITTTYTYNSPTSVADYTYGTTASGYPKYDAYYQLYNFTNSFSFYAVADPDPEVPIDPAFLFTYTYLLKTYANGGNANYSYNVTYTTDANGNINQVKEDYPQKPSFNNTVDYVYEQY